MAKADRGLSKGDVLRFMWMPQFGSAFRAFGEVFNVFVWLIANILSGVDLLPKTHPVVRGDKDALGVDGFGRILVDASANIRWGWRAVPQLTIFYAVIGMVICTVLSIAVAGMDLFISVAQAQQQAAQQSSDLFVYEGDQALAWLDSMFLLAGADAATDEMPIAAALGPMLRIYSYGALVLAGIILGYSIISMVVQTAHQGVLMGQQHNEVWAPIRLVFALGMLVPLGSGFNTGQAVVVQFAQWGSGLASNAWSTFVGALLTNQMAPVPNAPATHEVVRGLLLVEACKYAVREVNEKRGAEVNVERKPTGSAGSPTGIGPGLPMNYSYNRVSETGTVGNYCGSISLISELEANDAVQGDMPDEYRSRILAESSILATATRAHATALAAALDAVDGSNGIASQLARRAVHTDEAIESPPPNLLIELENAYSASLARALQGDIAAQQQATANTLSQNAITERGWIAAGSWYFDIARLNNRMNIAVNTLPTVSPRTDQLAGSFSDALTSVGSYINNSVSWLFASIRGAEPRYDDHYYVAKALAETEQWYNDSSALALTGDSGASNEAEAGYFWRMFSLFNIKMIIARFQESEANPLVKMVQFGNDLRNTGLALAGIGGGMEVFSDGLRKLGPIGRMLTSEDAEGNVSSPAGSLLRVIGLTLLLAGLGLSLALPLIPAVRFVFGIMTWLLSVFEAIVAIPVLALAHLRTDGEGLMGPMAQSGYLLMLQLFIRPILMVLGLIGGLMIFTVGIEALNIGMLEVVSITERNIDGGFSLEGVMDVLAQPTELIGQAAYVVIYFVIAITMANMAFKAIDMVPDSVMRWIGGPMTSSMSTGQSLDRGLSTFGRYEGSATGGAIAMARPGPKVPGVGG